MVALNFMKFLEEHVPLLLLIRPVNSRDGEIYIEMNTKEGHNKEEALLGGTFKNKVPRIPSNETHSMDPTHLDPKYGLQCGCLHLASP